MKNYTDLANCIRFLSIEAVEKAKSGHPGMPMGMADIATVLFHDFLIHNPKDPTWTLRDRFVLSNGHGSMLLYSLLYLTGYKKMTIDQIKNFRQLVADTNSLNHLSENRSLILPSFLNPYYLMYKCWQHFELEMKQTFYY